MRIGKTLRRSMMVAAAVPAMLAMSSTAALAAVNDDFNAHTTDGCGYANFIDYGPGAPGGGNNDDYVVVHDYCPDGHGVQAFVWINGEYWGDKYNGNGEAGAAVIWDPFKDYGPGNLQGGDAVRIKVCLVDGYHENDDSYGFRCGSASHVSADG